MIDITCHDPVIVIDLAELEELAKLPKSAILLYLARRAGRGSAPSSAELGAQLDLDRATVYRAEQAIRATALRW